jgi:hypothetical protein
MSSRGAAVGPAAKADSTGVTERGLLVGDGSCNGAEVTVGLPFGAEEQAFRIGTRVEIRNKANRIFFIWVPQ